MTRDDPYCGRVVLWREDRRVGHDGGWYLRVVTVRGKWKGVEGGVESEERSVE